MADHHDDRLDSALDLLRSRQWAGPATNPVLEKQFMHSIQEPRGLNLRIVLGVAGALIGCGAVAAATRPAWRSAIFGPVPQPPKVVAAVSPAPAAPTPAPAVRHAEPAPAVQPIQIADAEPTVADPAPQPTVEAPASEPEIFTAVEPDETEWLRTTDPDCFYRQALAAYLDRYMAGDVEGCAAIARKVDGTQESSTFAQLGALELQRFFAVSALTDAQADLTVGVRLNLVVSSLDRIVSGQSGDQVFEVVLDGQAIDGEGDFIADPKGNVFRVQGVPTQAGPAGSWVFTTSVPATPPAAPRR